MQANRPFVSLEVGGTDRARGILIYRNLVLLPFMSSQLELDLRKVEGRAEVLLASPEGAVAERIRVSHIEAHGLEDGELIGVAYLERPSGFSVSRIATVTSEQLSAELERHEGAISEALIDAIGVPTALFTDPLPQIDDVAKYRLVPESALNVARHPSVVGVTEDLCRCCLWWCNPTDPGPYP